MSKAKNLLNLDTPRKQPTLCKVIEILELWYTAKIMIIQQFNPIN